MTFSTESQRASTSTRTSRMESPSLPRLPVGAKTSGLMLNWASW